MQEEAGDRVRAQADFVTAIVLVALGVFVFINAYSMSRLEVRQIHPLTIPGLVPMALGAALAGFGLLLGYHGWRISGGKEWGGLLRVLVTREAARMAAATAMVLGFILGLIGLIPFWAASMVFIFAFIVVMETLLADKPVPFLRSAFWALMTAVFAGGGIYYLFAEIFLVRLP